jgi:tRNA threonylcarbamoyl adenosine modification protein (Sua5/YciO/YrdC/YwlC family)
MLLHINPDNIDDRLINQVIKCLKNGGVIIYPTDTVYTLGCDLTHPKAYEKICKLKNIKPNKANFSIVCSDLKHLNNFVQNLSNPCYRVMRKALPGPFTFILNANNQVAKIFGYNKKTIGIRIPDNPICLAIVDLLESPIISASIKTDDSILEYLTDANEIFEAYEGIVDMVIDGGLCGIEASTVIDFTGNEPLLVREGKGDINQYL